MKTLNSIYIYSAIILTFFVLGNTIAFGQESRRDNPSPYALELMRERQEKDMDFKTSDNSPIDAASRNKFNGLYYFDADTSWIISAKLTLFENPDTIAMKTTTDRLPLYLVFGTVEFRIKDTLYRLTVYRNIDLMKKPGYEDYLFIPFRDYTSGEQSYGGGRYLDVYLTQTGRLTLDFNKAYNPWCVYSRRYSCPLTPDENYLNVYVTAGEKNYDY
ncbi:MAG: DUF1684 domain-containing protein [Lentimicrobiaceae bacterium]|nr:DUF1684 domain-containing protein [Lentimicrobiaceae bacterium]